MEVGVVVVKDERQRAAVACAVVLPLGKRGEGDLAKGAY
jgi:hypothetical protein